MKEFSIPGNPEDYYVVSESNAGVKYDAARSQIRRLVEAYSSYIQYVASSGGNPHTASLDLSDKVKNFISNEPAEAQLAFYDVYTQEMNAATASTMDDTIKLNTEATKKQESAAMAGQWIGALIIFLLVLAFLFYK